MEGNLHRQGHYFHCSDDGCVRHHYESAFSISSGVVGELDGVEDRPELGSVPDGGCLPVAPEGGSEMLVIVRENKNNKK